MSEIDVKKCPHYEDEICYSEGVLYKYCNQCDDCMYKTFQQLKAENEELKKYIDRAGIIGIIKVLKCLDGIEEKVKKLCKRCALDFKVEDTDSIPNEEYCDDTVCYFILQKIKEVKE